MILSLEALRARHGDALLLHCGKTEAPDLYVIDGGWFHVYGESLKPRLEQLRNGAEELPIRLLMISHVDQDHIQGVIEMTQELRARKQDHAPLPYVVQTIWHNAFDDIIGNGAKTLQAVGEAGVALAGANPEGLAIPVEEEAAIRLAGIAGGRTLRDDAKLLGMEINKRGFKGLMRSSKKPLKAPFTPGVDIHVLGPSTFNINELRKEWDKYLKEKHIKPKEAAVALADYLDSSVPNLASIVALVRCGGKEILLTGDARGDFLLKSVEAAGLFGADGKRLLDVLKVPHHGSDHNVEVDFFEKLPADHYVFSGDGQFGNPEIKTFEMLFEARSADARPFTIHLTYDPVDFRENSQTKKKYPLAKLKALFKKHKDAGRSFSVSFPKPGELGLRIDLLDPYQGP